MMSSIVVGSVVVSALMGAALYLAYNAGVMAERKRKATYTLGEAVRAYTISTIAILSALVLLGKVL